MTARRTPRAQLDLFATTPAQPAATSARQASRGRPHAGGHAVGAATPPRDVRALRDAMPESLHMGTSSWSFPGWASIVYDGAFTQRQLARDGLAAYARHPLFRTVCVDKTHYAPADADDLAGYADAVPDGFQFVVKAHEACTLARFPPHPRYGKHRDQPNPLFLDPGHAGDASIAPVVEGLGAHAGPILFQFAPQSVALLGGPERFADRLHRFLFSLPSGPRYAVELRNRALLTRRYAAALADVGACHCIGLHPGMPDVATQWRIATSAGATPPAVIARWMLAPHLTYATARDRFAPFGALVDEDPRARDGLAQLVRDSDTLGIPCYVIVNNKAEGSAPLSIVRLAEAIAARPR